MDNKLRIEVSGLMQTRLDPFRLKYCLFKYLVIGKEIDLGSGRLGLTDYRQQAVNKLRCRNTSRIAVLIYLAVTCDLNCHFL